MKNIAAIKRNNLKGKHYYDSSYVLVIVLSHVRNIFRGVFL